MELILFLIVIAAIFITIILIHNNFISLINRTKEAWSDIDVQLKRKYDLVPQLVEAVKKYSFHEKELFEKITEARSKAIESTSISQKGEADRKVSDDLRKIFAVAEAYPDLKASGNFLKLQEQLTETEDIIASARRFYNGNVRELNIKIESFPSNLIAGLFNFKKREFFQLEQEAGTVEQK